jgi:16S rRNA (uracil1498-N3)-methyltransferase
MSFEQSVDQAKKFPKSLFFDIGGKNFDSVSKSKDLRDRTLWIGPEGGWDKAEIEIAENKLEIVSLGKLTLRAETAAIVASYLVVNL